MPKKRVVYFDILNVCASFCVVWLHCDSSVFTFSDSLSWKFRLVVEVIAFWAVPIFFMLSGATLLTYREKYDTKSFFQKRFIKTILPFLVWSLISLIFKCAVGWYQMESWNWKHLIDLFVNNRMEPIYWFFIPLFMVYACMPVLSLLAKHRKVLWYMVLLYFATYSFLPVIFEAFSIPYNSFLSFPLTGGGYVALAILGYLLSTEDLSKKKRYIIYALGLFGLIFRYAVTYTMSMKIGDVYRLLFNYNSFPSVLLAAAVFVLFKSIRWSFFDKKTLMKLLNTLSACSFGIYLIHMFVIIGFVKLFERSPSGVLGSTVVPVVVYCISFGITYLLKQIPVLKRIVP